MSFTLLEGIKLGSMIIMFFMIAIVGNIPLRSNIFKEQSLLLSLTGAFSGGLFISVGIIHLLPESIKYFHMYFEQNKLNPMNQFPFSCLITVLSFTLILYIEKIAFQQNHSHSTKSIDLSVIQQSENDSEIDKQSETSDKNHQMTKEEINNPLTPYILQIAIGIHAYFEGLAIGIEQNVGQCIGISLAIICHKWAEGLTLGLSFKKSNTQLKMATLMILIQAIINPLGILTGWLLSNAGYLITGIFQSISSGTFIYIATMEVIAEQFQDKSYQHLKMLMFLIAIGFVSSIWFIESCNMK